jgi:hypothetical protein
MGIIRIRKLYDILPLSASFFKENCYKLLQWYNMDPSEGSLSYLVRLLKIALNKLQLGMESAEIFSFTP